MHRRTINLGGPVTGVAIAAMPAPAAPAPNDVLLFAPPPVDPANAALNAPAALALRNLLAGLDAAIEKLRTRESAAIDSIAQATVELAVALAERLLSAEISADRQRLDRIVRDALEHMQPARAVTVRGHADDLGLLQRQIAEHGELSAAQSTLSFRAEKAGERGQLKIEADEWFVDFDTQRSLAELRDRLLEETFAHE